MRLCEDLGEKIPDREKSRTEDALSVNVAYVILSNSGPVWWIRASPDD